MRFHKHIDSDDMYARLLAASQKNNSGFNVYTHETMPARFHFSGNERIAPIYVVPHVGWAVSNHAEFYGQMKGNFHPVGNHGYDNQDPSMHAIFVAHGPFANELKKSALLKRAGEQLSTEEGVTVIPAFDNTEIYSQYRSSSLTLACLSSTHVRRRRARQDQANVLLCAAQTSR